MLCGLALMSQAVFLNGQDLDHSPSIDDGFVSAEVDVGRRQVTEAFVVAAVIEAPTLASRAPGNWWLAS